MPLPAMYGPGALIDHYSVVRPLGSGAANHVYMACDLLTDQQVVLKFPREDVIGGAAIFASYRQEMLVGGLLHHPGVARLLNQGEPRSAEYLVFEYRHGRTLRALLHHRRKSGAALSVEELLSILLPVCEILSYVHAQGVIHRDIKPENILIGDDGSVTVLDFGISLLKHVPSSTNRRKMLGSLADVVGTPAYMSPERLRGEPGDEQCDMYAVGMVLYEALSGRIPFPDPDGFSLTTMQIAYDPPDILRLNPHLAPVVATVVMRTIRRDAEKRYATIQELLTALQHLEQVIPVPYVPDRPLLGGRFRQVWLVALIVFVIVLLIIAFGLFAQFVHG